MKFDDATAVEQVCYEFKLADFPRGLNRARINDLFNGVPPYTEEERERNAIAVNVNYLEATRIAHDARAQFYGAFQKPGNYFGAKSDMGPVHKRSTRSSVVTKEVNKVMKRSLKYFEKFRSTFALDVLHGIGPASWDNRDKWCPRANGVEDMLIPSNTDLDMDNLPFFAIYRSYTAPQLIRLTRSAKRDPGWNMKLVEKAIKWIDRETLALMGTNWPEIWAPEKLAERVKGDGGFYAGDQVPTIDCFDFYFWSDEGKQEGWNRRIILDSWSTPQMQGGQVSMASRASGDYDFGKGEFLFNPKNRKYGAKLSEIASFQFADMSAVGPFRYHSVRSLGFLLYAICHLQNRLRCKFNEAVFEALLQYIRVKSMDDAERALKIELANRGIIDESVQFLSPQERWQVNAPLVQLGLTENDRLIRESAASYRQAPEFSKDQVEKTKFQVMAEVQAMTAMVGSGLTQAYRYQSVEYQEIFRRFCRKNSSDPDVVRFRSACLKQGVPENMLVPEAWELEPERVMGSGNKTLEMAIAQQLMEYRNLFDPEPQRQILRDVTLAITDDAARAEQLVPDEPNKVTDSVHDAQLASAALMMGLPVGLKTGMNHIEYVDTLLINLQLVIAKANQRGGMATMDEIDGMQRIAQHISEHVAKIAEDPNEKERVADYGKTLSKLMNYVRAFAQRLQQQQQQQAQGNGQPQMDPKDMAKIQAIIMQAKVKAQNTKESHAQRTAQRQIQFEQEMKQREIEAAQGTRHALREHGAELAKTGAEARQNIQINRMKSLDDKS